MGVVVGNRGYYSKASGTRWVTHPLQKQTPLALKNNLRAHSGKKVRTANGLFRTKA